MYLLLYLAQEKNSNPTSWITNYIQGLSNKTGFKYNQEWDTFINKSTLKDKLSSLV